MCKTLCGFTIIWVIIASTVSGAWLAVQNPDSILGRLSGSHDLWRAYEQAVEENRRLNNELAELRAELSGARAQVSSLMREVRDANHTIERLRSALAEANEVIKEQNQTIQELSGRIESLLEEKIELENRIESLEEERNRLQGRLNKITEHLLQAAKWYGLGDDFAIDRSIVAIAPATVRDPAASLLADLSTTEERVKAVMDWIQLNLQYVNDSVVRIVDPETGEVRAYKHYLMLPNETMSVGGGDCDDLALLAYSLLRAYPLPGESVYLVAWWSLSTGHVAVVVKSPEGLYYILDPAGDYLNRYAVLLEMTAEERSSGGDYIIWYPTISLDPTYKKWLVNESFADIVYDKWFSFSIWPAPRPEWPEQLGDPDIESLLVDWIIYYWEEFPVQLAVITGDLYEEFDSIRELAYWLETH